MILAISIAAIVVITVLILNLFYSPIAMIGTLLLYVLSNIMILLIANVTIYYILKIPYSNLKLDRFRYQVLLLYEKIYILNFWRNNDDEEQP